MENLWIYYQLRSDIETLSRSWCSFCKLSGNVCNDHIIHSAPGTQIISFIRHDFLEGLFSYHTGLLHLVSMVFLLSHNNWLPVNWKTFSRETNEKVAKW